MAKAESLVAKMAEIQDGTIISLTGEIDYSRTPHLRQELVAIIQQKKPKRLVLDLTGVPYMDSSGVATLIEMLQTQRKAGSRLVLCCLQPKVRGIFEIARLNTVFTITPDAEAAKQA